MSRYSPVYARWQGDCFFEPATVTEVNADGTFDLQYYSGKREGHAPRAHLRPQEASRAVESCKAQGCVLVLGGGCEGTWPTPTMPAAAEALECDEAWRRADQEVRVKASAEDAGARKKRSTILGGETEDGTADSTIDAPDRAAQKQVKDDARVKAQLEDAAAAQEERDGAQGGGGGGGDGSGGDGGDSEAEREAQCGGEQSSSSSSSSPPPPASLIICGGRVGQRDSSGCDAEQEV